MRPKVIRRKKGTPPPKEKTLAEMLPAKTTKKPRQDNPQKKEVKSLITPRPRERLSTSTLLTEIAKMDRSEFDRRIQTPQKTQVGEQVEGTVIRIEKEFIIIDIGAKSEAFLWKENTIETDVAVQQRISAFVTSITSNGIQLSQKTQASLLQHLQEAKENQTPIQATVISVNNGGFVLQSEDILGFCPKSQIDIHVQDGGEYLNQRFSFLITDIQKDEFIASRKVLLEQENKDLRAQIITSLSQGMADEGTVVAITDFGVFISVFNVEGLLPKRKIPPEKTFSVGDRVAVKIDTIDMTKQKISLALDQKDPWLELGHRYQLHQPYTGKVIQHIEHGMLVALQFELIGMVHRSKFPNPAHIDKQFPVGHSVEVYISSYDLSKRKLNLQLDPPVIISEAQRPTGHHFSDLVRDLFSEKKNQ